MCRLWVYNAEFFCGLWTPIRTSDSTDEVKFKKSVFWDTLVNTLGPLCLWQCFLLSPKRTWKILKYEQKCKNRTLSHVTCG